MSLAYATQDDFSAGAFPNQARDLIPRNGVGDAVNCLINDDGQLSRRGGSTYYTTNWATPPLNGMAQVWDGYLTAGQRTLGVSIGNSLGYWNGSAWTDLASSVDTTKKFTVLGSSLIVPHSSGGEVWGGSTQTSAYTTGTVTVTQGSTTVVGAGTTWTGNVQVGSFFRINPGNLYFVVSSVTDNTHLELVTPYTGSTAAGANYVTTGNMVPLPSGGSPIFGATFFLAAAGRLLAYRDRTIFESAIGSPWVYSATNYVELPEGALPLGAEYLRDTAYTFTTNGVYALSNVAFDITDASGNPQQKLEQINRDLILWSWIGVAQWGNTLIVPATNGVWLFDGISNPQKIDGGIGTLYRSYVDAGYRTGQAAVFNSHYILPILDGSNNVVDTLVCRLTATRRGTVFGWTRLSGGEARGFAVRVGQTTRQPILLGANAATKRLSQHSYWDGSVATDADGTVHQATVVNAEPNDEVKSLTKKVRIRYELTDPSTIDPTVTAEWAQADGAYTPLAGSAAETTKPSTKTWTVSQRNPHFRFKTVGATTKFVLHSITTATRRSGRQ